jgi:hypothetical protein
MEAALRRNRLLKPSRVDLAGYFDGRHRATRQVGLEVMQ